MDVNNACVHHFILTDDGDTHIHPLDDPRLKSSSVAAARTHQESNESQPGTHALELQEVCMNNHGHADDSALQSETKTETQDKIHTTSSPSPINGTSHKNKPARVSATNFSFRSQARTSAYDNGQPLSPISLNKHIISTVNNTMKTPTIFASIHKHELRTGENSCLSNAITPGASHVRRCEPPDITISAGVSTDALIAPAEQKHDDGRDDDIVSRFTECTDSLSSYSTTLSNFVLQSDGSLDRAIVIAANEKLKTSTALDSVKEQLPSSKEEEEPSQTLKLKSKRVASSPTKAAHVGTSKKKSKTATRGTETAKTVENKLPAKRKQASKQTTLNSWFKKNT
jgi:hypothetical protein